MHETFRSYISFYFKASRIHLFLEALRGLGSPSRVCFKIDETGNKLMMIPYIKRDFVSHSIPKSVYTSGEGMEISSLKLCKIIANIHGLDLNKSFRFPGVVDVDMQVAVFDLTKAQEIHQSRTVYRNCVSSAYRKENEK